MSTLKVDAIRHNSATIDAITTAADGTCTARITGMTGGGGLSHRNLIINGAMQVAQRGTSSTSSSYQTVDRFITGIAISNENPTQSQHTLTSSDTGPYEEGFRFSYHITNGNQTSPNLAANNIYIRQRIEAQNVAQSGWNYTSSSSFITLQFWVKSSVAQNFYGYLRTADGTSQRYAFETGSLSANTWTKITKTIPGNSNLQIDNNNENGLDVVIIPFWGTDQTDPSVPLNAWGAFSSSTRTPDSTSTWYTTNDATFEITGVQLEVGDTATSFEHRSFADELMRCYRYFYGPTGEGLFGVGRTTNASTMWSVQFPTQMRGNPSLSITSTTITIAEPNQSNFNITSASIANAHISKNSAAFYLNGTMSVSVGDNLFLTDDYLKFGAEL